MPSRFRIRQRARELPGLVGSDFFQHATPLLIATVLASLAVYGFHFFASRRLGVDRYGALAALLAGVTLVAVVSTAGTNIVARFAAEIAAVGDSARLRRLLDLLTQWCAVLLVAGAAVASAFRAPLAAFLRINDAEALVLVEVLLGVTVTVDLLRGVMQGTQRFNAFSVSFILQNAGRALVGSLGIALGYGIRGALWGQIVAVAAALLYTYVALRKAFRERSAALRVDPRRVLATSGGIAVAALGLAVLSYFDIILAKHYLDAHDAGLYGFATLPGRALSAVISFLPTLILPKATARAVAGRQGHALLYGAAGLAVAILLVALGLLYAFSTAIVTRIAGPAYAAAAPLIFPYGCAMAFFALTSIAVSYKMGRHRFDFVPPLIAVVAVEITAIALIHGSAAQIITIVLCANAAAFAASLFRITAPAAC